MVLGGKGRAIEVDIITQTDLHYRPSLLDAYPCVTIVGHDEYWTHEMRVADRSLCRGRRHLARFGGNFLWQIRLEDEGRRQVCYKFDAINGRSLAGHRAGASADDGVGGSGGQLARRLDGRGQRGCTASTPTGVGFAPRGQKGFTVYRPSHWAFAGTGLNYADIFGDKARILGYEVDGLDYTFRRGLPYPVPVEGAPETIEILAMAPAVLAEGERTAKVSATTCATTISKVVKCITGGVAAEDSTVFATVRP